MHQDSLAIDNYAVYYFEDTLKNNEVREQTDELNNLVLNLHMETTLKNIATSNDLLSEIKWILNKNNIDENKNCKILSDKTKEQTGKVYNFSNRFFKRWVCVEFELNDVPVRIVSSALIRKYGILLNGEWSYFRSFGNVLNRSLREKNKCTV